ncbi:hypothetical protein [Bacillus sp. Marseille-P3661]|uniref:hypothetical protein n=1 Tax=Bacillus sp. Marseille-P3661 TaxID=1936234 RepID=UPI000C85AF5C|nr:hypothetical protein [Bacillus sp. Marseille-P3661]
MQIKSGTIEKFEQYSQFSSLREFNRHIEMWLLERKSNFSKSELVGLKRLIRYAAKIPGVCNAKIGTMLKAIHEEYQNNGISRSTFKRMIQKAITIGIFNVYETERKNGSQSSNLYVFNRFPCSDQLKSSEENSVTIPELPTENLINETNDNNELPTTEKLNHHNETINLSKTKKEKELNKRYEDREKLDYTFASDKVPQAFVQWVKIYFRDPKTIDEFWKMTNIAAFRNNLENETELVLSTAIAAFKQLIRKIKMTKQIVHKPVAYFYGIVHKKLEAIYLEELFEMRYASGNNTEDEEFWADSPLLQDR